MHGQAGPRDGDFDAGGKAHAQLFCCGGSFGDAAHFVVIGQCPDIDAIGERPLRHVPGRKRAVRNGGMAMQVDVQGGRFHAAIVEKARRHA